MHPHAYANNKSSGPNGLKAGDRVRYIQRGSSAYGRTGVVDEFLPDNDAFNGDAYVTWDDGEHAIVKHIHLASFTPVVAKAAKSLQLETNGVAVQQPGTIKRLLSKLGFRAA